MSRLLAGVLLLAAAGPAGACINDVELPSHEREFRSQYGGPVAPPSPEPAGRAGVALLAGAGAVMLVAGFALALGGRRAGG
jgi:hypothetical protein